MKERIKKVIQNSDIKYYIVIGLVAVLLATPFMAKGFWESHDGDFHISRVVATMISLKEGQIPALVNWNFANGLGYGSNIFYPPLAAYLPIALLCVTFDVLNAFKFMLYLTILFSGITMFCFLKEITQSKKIALFAAILYMTAPYRLIDLYIRVAVGELLGFVFLPMVFHGMYAIISKEGKKSYLLIIGAVGMLLTHNISALLTVGLAVIYLLVEIKKVIQKRVLKQFAICAIFIILIVSFFYGPFFEISSATQYHATIFKDLYEMEESTFYPFQVLTGQFQNAERMLSMSNEQKLNQDISMMIGFQLIIPLLFTPFLYAKIQKKYRKMYVVTILLGLGCVFATTNLFPWEWFHHTVISYIQFPMRFMWLASFLLSIVGAVNLGKMIQDEEAIKETCIITMLILIYIQPFLSMPRFTTRYNINYAIGIDDTSQMKKQIHNKTCAGFEYLPAIARKNMRYLMEREPVAILQQGNTEITKQEKIEGKMTIVLTNTTEDTVLELPYVYYKGYVAKIGKQKLEVQSSEKGLVNLIIPKGMEGTIEIRYETTLLTRVSLGISMIGVIACFWYYRRLKNKKIGNK